MQKHNKKQKSDEYYKHRFEKTLYYGRKSFTEYKKIINDMLHTAASYWDKKKKPLTKKEYDDREFLYSFTDLAVGFYNRIKEANQYRESIKFRNCKFKKYVDNKNQRIIFELKYMRVINKVNFHKCLILYYKQSPIHVYKAELSDALSNISSLPFSEFGRFRYSPTDTGIFNIYFYHKNGANYAYNFIRTSADVYKVKPIINKMIRNIDR